MNNVLVDITKNNIEMFDAIIDALDTLHLRGYKDCKTYSNVCEVVRNMSDENKRALQDYEANLTKSGEANGNDN